MGNSNLNLGEAASHFLASLPPEKAGSGQQTVHHFVRWFGRESLMAALEAPEIAGYARRISSSDADYSNKLDTIRAFLTYAKEKGWTKTNLATHLKAKKEKPGLNIGARQGLAKPVTLTRQGYDEIKEELAALKGKRLQAIDEVRRAAADKDFRENAPLDAAREQLGRIEGRIGELEQALKSATLVGDEVGSKTDIGNSITLLDLTSGKETRYTIVSPREVDPARGRISSVSPLGKALIGREPGDTVEITVPAGRLRYRIEKVSGKTNRTIDTDSAAV